MFRRFKSFPYLILILAPLILFSPILFTGKALFWGTPSTQFIPWWQAAWELLIDGQLPLWNPWLGMGAPLLANYQSALLYPPTWIYLLLWLIGGTPAMAWVMALLVAFHLIWACLGMAMLIRRLGLGILSQVIAGLAYGLSGYLVARAGFLSINAATSWSPWIILGVTCLVETVVNGQLEQPSQIADHDKLKFKRSKQTWVAGIILSIGVGMLLLAGHAQSAWYTLVFAGVWGLFWFDYSYRRLFGRGPSIKLILKLSLFFLGIILAALCLAAAQLLPTAEYLLQSQRSAAVDFEYAMTYSFWPWRGLTLIAPALYGSPASGDYWGYGNYWEDAIYIGLTPFILALAAIFSRLRRSRLVFFLVMVILVTFILSLGKNTPIFPWLYRHFPTFDMFQAPTRINLIMILSLAVLAAIGASSWCRPVGRGLYWTRLGTMAAAAMTVGAFVANVVAVQVLTDIDPSLIRGTALAGVFGVGFGMLTLAAPERPEDQFTSRRNSLWGWAAIIWVATDLVIAGWGLNPGIDLDFYRYPSRSAETVQEIIGDGRLYLSASDEDVLKFDWLFRFDTFHPFPSESEWEVLRSALLPNIPSLDHIPSANNFDPLLPSRYVTWMKILDDASLHTWENFMNLMAVSVVEVVNVAQPYDVGFLGRLSLPHARWVPCGIYVQDGQAALEALLQGGENLEQVVWLENNDMLAHADCTPGKTADITITEQQPNKIMIATSSTSPGYVVIANTWYPGWSAWVDNQPSTIWKANYLFQAVQIPAGDHHVVVTYRPGIFITGCVISILALIGIIALIIYVRRFST